MKHHAQAVSTPPVAPHLSQMAELSTQAVAMVLDLRTLPAEPPELHRRNAIGDYHDLATKIMDEDNAVLDGCQLR